jgi:hypothetical protein
LLRLILVTTVAVIVVILINVASLIVVIVGNKSCVQQDGEGVGDGVEIWGM